MPSIICGQCNAVIPDPCPTTVVLFEMKKSMLNMGLSITDPDITAVNRLLQNQVGLADHESHFEAFIRPGTTRRNVRAATPKVFILRCINGHRNQVTQICP